MRESWRNRVIGILLFVFASGLVISSQRDQGIARDEIVYMNYGTRYADWWIDLATGKSGTTHKDTITKHFGGKRPTDGNREHPPLMKTLFGLSERLLHDELGWTSQTTGYRVPTALVNGLLVCLVFFFVLGIWGRTAAISSALLVLFLPRAFFHAGLASFDAPVVTFWFASLFAYYRALRTRWGFLWLGLCCGLTLATKHNAIMLPAVFLPHYAYFVWRKQSSEGPRWRRLWDGLAQSRPQVLLGLFAVAPLVLIAIWPWLWFDTITHLRDWIGFHLGHVHYNFEYLGTNWNAPPFPWHVALVTTLFTVPLATLVAALTGFVMIVVRFRRGERADGDGCPALLLFLSAGVAMGPFLLRTTPIFGAEKHWAPAIPSLCIFAGLGLVWMANQARDSLIVAWPKWHRGVLRYGPIALLLTTTIGAAWSETLHAHPYSLTHYNALAGGAPGGASLGMNRQFWGYSARGVLPFINKFRRSDVSVPVYTHDASPAWGHYKAEGLLGDGLPDAGHEKAGIRKSKIAIVVHEKHFARHDILVWEAYKKVQPSFVLQFDGVPIVSVYVRDELLDK